MNMFDGIQLFRRVAAKHSFSAAAKELGIVQPTVSKAIATLEMQLGVQLFVRSPRGLSLTTAGERLLDVGVPAVDQLEDALALVRKEPSELTGQLRVASNIAFARHVVVPTLEDFSTLHPELRLNLVLHDGPPNIVRDGVDLAIRFGRATDGPFTATKVGSEKRAVYAAPSYLERHGRPETIEDLRGHRLAYFNLVHRRPRWRFNYLDGSVYDFFFEPYIQADASDVIRETLLAGLCIAYAPTWMMTVPEREGRLVRLLDDHCAARQVIFLVSAGPRPMPAKQRAFVDFLQNRCDANPELTLRRTAPGGTAAISKCGGRGSTSHAHHRRREASLIATSGAAR
jgi:DNA-binding transcriptional LysR family regulator